VKPAIHYAKISMQKSACKINMQLSVHPSSYIATDSVCLCSSDKKWWNMNLSTHNYTCGYYALNHFQ